MRWLMHKGGKDILRINSDDDMTGVTLRLSDKTAEFRIGNKVFPIAGLKAVWYRKGTAWLSTLFHKIKSAEQTDLSAYLNQKLREEQDTLSDYLHYRITTEGFCLGTAARQDLNKLVVLHKAGRVGLRTPAYFVGNEKEELLARSLNIPQITKALSDGIYFFDFRNSETAYFSYTEQVDTAALHHSPAMLSPSLLQEQIQKQYEIRVFYLMGTCYAMAIFSQTSSQTQTDFRKYTDGRPGRMVPYQLPTSIENKLQQLFHDLGLNTGSADLLVDQQGRFYFLEINPSGQFEMVAQPCNYPLTQRVAELLIDKNK